MYNGTRAGLRGFRAQGKTVLQGHLPTATYLLYLSIRMNVTTTASDRESNFMLIGFRSGQEGGLSRGNTPLAALSLGTLTWKISCRSISYRAKCQLQQQALCLLPQCRASPGVGPDSAKLVKLPLGQHWLWAETSVLCKLCKCSPSPGSISSTGLAWCCLEVLCQANARICRPIVGPP